MGTIISTPMGANGPFIVLPGREGNRSTLKTIRSGTTPKLPLLEDRHVLPDNTSADPLFNFGFPPHPDLLIPGNTNLTIPVPILDVDIFWAGPETYIRVPAESETQYQAAYYLGYCGLPDELQRSLQAGAQAQGHEPACPGLEEEGHHGLDMMTMMKYGAAFSGGMLMGLYLVKGWQVSRKDGAKTGKGRVVGALKGMGVMMAWPAVLLWKRCNQKNNAVVQYV